MDINVVTNKLKRLPCQRQEEIYPQMNHEQISNLQQQNQKLLNKVQSQDEFLNNLCQELRAPLTHMKTALSLLNSPQLKVAQRQRYLQLLNTECDRQNSLINGLLELVQLHHSFDTTKLETVSISDIVPGVVSTYQPLAQEKGILLGYTLPTEIPQVTCVTPWLRQIVINLLHNSIKFTPPGGQVWVRDRIQNQYVVLECSDTGIGIPETEISHIFECFYRVRPASGLDNSGAGLGLTIVRDMLQHCGGSISVKSHLGKGSIFTILLPIAPNN